MEKSKIWYLENFNLFTCLQLEDRVKLAALAIMEHKPKNSTIYFPQDSCTTIFLVKKGKIKISRMAPNGRERELILDMLGPGEIFGELALTGQDNRDEIAEAAEDTLICSFRSSDFENVLKENPALSLQVTKLIGLRLKKVQTRLENLFFKNAAERIIDFIKELALTHGRILPDNNGIVIKVNMTHADIAKLTATNRQKVTSVLNELEKQDLIHYSRKQFYIKDPALIQNAVIIAN